MRRRLVGSWAGAIGHLQVNPSNVVAHGTDGDGDGRVDLQIRWPMRWRRARGSCATRLPAGHRLGHGSGGADGFDYLLATRTQMRPISFFAERGITRVAGRQFADPNLPVFLYVPAGKDGPKFLMTRQLPGAQGLQFLRQLRDERGASDRPAQGRRRLCR